MRKLSLPDIDLFLTPRLKMVADAVPESRVVCDIGTDHAYVPIYLIKNKICRSCIAADIRKGPLKAAQENIKKFGVENDVKPRLSDGFCALSQFEAETAIIAGMGGETIAKILEKDIGVKNFVLQPQTAKAFLRLFLQQNGYLIKKEYLCREGEKMYVCIFAARGKMPPLSETEAQIGPVLIKERPPLFKEYVRYRKREIDCALEKMRFAGSAWHRREEFENLKAEYERLIDERA